MRHAILSLILCALLALTAASCSSAKRGAATKRKPASTHKVVKGGGNGQLRDSRTEKPGGNLAKACARLGVSPNGVKNKTLYIESASWIGTSYKYGGMSRSGVDCSGLTGLIYKAVYGKKLSRSSAGILQDNCKRINKSGMREGDLVFFRTDGKRSKTPNHVGIYLKEGKFIHSSSSKGVIVSSMAQDYYVRNFIAAGRVP